MPRPRTILMPNAQPAELPRRNFIAKLFGAALGGAFLAQPRAARASTTGLDPYVGEIALFGFNFAPTGWALCNGQLLSIQQNTALFSLIGTYYGGDGVTTFGLPDLRGRVPIAFGAGPGLPNYAQGQQGGAATVTLNANQMPAHNHSSLVSSANGTSDVPTGGYPARDPSGVPRYAAASNNTFAPAQIGLAGGNQPHENMPPYLVLNWCIALQGIYPTRP